MSQGLLDIWSSNIFLKHLKDDDKPCYLHITVASGEGKETVSAILRGHGRMRMRSENVQLLDFFLVNGVCFRSWPVSLII